ncbi:MAG: RNA pseudouridine synthase, partial [Lachnospiraceae bacterium]|nr:RNA pseudouridine synthase [Lachnospiraceae bacterium]
QLLTGKSHQIRAQLAHLGLPVVGDGKYGDEAVNRELAGRLGLPLRHQLLHAYQIVFPDALQEGAALSAAMEEEWKKLAGRRFTAPLPVHFERVLALLGR